MSILDEDKSKFSNDADKRDVDVMRSIANEHGYYVTEILYTKCNAVCSRCIGRKYNIQKGCPVCGGDIRTVGNVPPMILSYRCDQCGLVAVGCGSGDVQTIGITVSLSETKDDVI